MDTLDIVLNRPLAVDWNCVASLLSFRAYQGTSIVETQLRLGLTQHLRPPTAPNW